MILESHIRDESKITFDCAKATLHRGSKVNIDDIHYKSPEIQNAIRMGLVSIVGQPPVFPEEAIGLEPEKLIRFRNNYSTKLCFECIKDYADPGMMVRVPVSKLEEPEIRNAIHCGWLVNEDNPEQNPVVFSGPPLQLEELRTSDILTGVESDLARDLAQALKKPVTAQALPENVPATRPKAKRGLPASQIKAKRVASSGEGGDDEDAGLDDLYRPSEVRLPKQPAMKKPVSKPVPMPVEDTEPGEGPRDDDFDFTDIFSGKK